MRCLAKSGVIFLASILLSIVFSPACPAAKYEEKGLQVIPLVSEGKITGVKVMIKAANGGPKINILQLNYPYPTVLAATASLTAGKGFYKIELLEKDQPSLSLATQGGNTVKGNDRLSVSASGALQYIVTARKAKDVVLDFSFRPVPEELRVSRTSSEKKLSSDGSGLNLILTCIAGKNCSLRTQNISRSKAYRNILFQIDYKEMTKKSIIEKSKRGRIKDALLPDETGEWPIDLIFKEPPKDIKISLIKAEAVKPARITLAGIHQPNNGLIPLVLFEKQKESDVKEKLVIQVNTDPSAPAVSLEKASPASIQAK